MVQHHHRRVRLWSLVAGLVGLLAPAQAAQVTLPPPEPFVEGSAPQPALSPLTALHADRNTDIVAASVFLAGAPLQPDGWCAAGTAAPAARTPAAQVLQQCAPSSAGPPVNLSAAPAPSAAAHPILASQRFTLQVRANE